MAKRKMKKGPRGKLVAKKIKKWATRQKKGKKLTVAQANYLRGAIAHKIQVARRGGGGRGRR